MINKILRAITDTLYQAFGDEYNIYIDDVEQGFQEPCFYVTCIAPTDVTYLKNRRYFNNLFVVHYFPKVDSSSIENYEVLEKLSKILDVLEVPDIAPLRASSMAFEKSEDVWVCKTTYNHYYFTKGELEAMEELDIKEGVKEND